MRDIIVIGGGAAGMMAAIKAAEKGCKPLFSRNEICGKDSHTGKGRCNLITKTLSNSPLISILNFLKPAFQFQ